MASDTTLVLVANWGFRDRKSQVVGKSLPRNWSDPSLSLRECMKAWGVLLPEGRQLVLNWGSAQFTGFYATPVTRARLYEL